MGSGFRWLLGSFWVSNLGDGIVLAAGPLLVASQTGDAVLVALAGLLQRLPWLLFGLYAGVVADRHDRRTLTIIVNLVRAAVLAVLAGTIVADAVNVPIVLVAMFALGAAETFADITTGTLMPMVVGKADLGVANARLTAGHITLNQLVGPPLGAFLFAAGMVWPFLVQAVACALAALLMVRIAFDSPAPTPAHEHARHAVAEGVRWLWHHPPMRTLALTIVSFNVTFGAAISVLVLYADQRLDAGEIGFGLLTTAGAIGGIVGSGLYGWLERTIGMANIMRAGLVIETLTHLSLASTTSFGFAVIVFVVFGMHEAAWGTTSITVRQRAVPSELQGRVGAVYMVGLMGGLVVGAGLGGVIAKVWGVTGPYWFAFAGSAVILVLIWPRLSQITATSDPGR